MSPRPWRTYRLELDFRRAVRRVPRRAWLRRYTRTPHQRTSAATRPTAELPDVARARHTRTFYQLDPATGQKELLRSVGLLLQPP